MTLYLLNHSENLELDLGNEISEVFYIRGLKKGL